MIPLRPTDRPAAPALAEFLPSRHGFRFANAFSPEVLGQSLAGNLVIGLCGGMSFAVMDYFLASQPIPSHTTPPAAGWLLNYLVRRQLHSLHLPQGIWRYYRGMLPGRAQQTLDESLHQEWPLIRAELEAGRPCPVGLIFARTANPARLVHNHQVLAYGYMPLAGNGVRLQLYDPNYPTNDRVSLDFGAGSGLLPMHSMGRPVYGFFHTPYIPGVPPQQ